MVPPVLWICLNSKASLFWHCFWPCAVYCFSARFQKIRGGKKKRIFMTWDNHFCLSCDMFYFKCKLLVKSLRMGGSGEGKKKKNPHRTEEHNKELSLEYHQPLLYFHCCWSFGETCCTLQCTSLKAKKQKESFALTSLLVSVFYLECILCVVQTVDPDVIVQSCAGDGSKHSQFEPLGGCLADWLAHQAVSPQGLR